MRPVAALFVERGGAYWEQPGVDCWDIQRDARLYAGPNPVVAHPPCARWSRLAGFTEARFGYRRGDDGGAFAAALAAVEQWGGVLEHPAWSAAWRAYGLPVPMTGGGWSGDLFRPGCAAYVEQGRYGHPAKKATWLYAVGAELPALRWGHTPDQDGWGETSWTGTDTLRGWKVRVPKRAALATPPEFRDALLGIARSVNRSVAV